jgi:hypothetical protein
MMTDIRWTPSLVEEHLAEAADVLKRLPERKAQGYFNTWPAMSYEFSDLVGRPATLSRPPPSSDAIRRMEDALTWTIFKDRLAACFGRALEGCVRHCGPGPRRVSRTLALRAVFDCGTSQRPSSATQLLTSPRHCRSARSELMRSR